MSTVESVQRIGERRITIQRPSFTAEELKQINEACVDRLRGQFEKAQKSFEELMDAQTSDFHKLWLQS